MAPLHPHFKNNKIKLTVQLLVSYRRHGKGSATAVTIRHLFFNLLEEAWTLTTSTRVVLGDYFSSCQRAAREFSRIYTLWEFREPHYPTTRFGQFTPVYEEPSAQTWALVIGPNIESFK